MSGISTSLHFALKNLRQSVAICLSDHLILHNLTSMVIEDQEFQRGYGSSTSPRQHHCYAGGLVVHTAEVVRGCLGIALAYPEAHLPTLVTAAVWHDYDKIHDYQKDRDDPSIISKTESGRLIRHVVGSAAKWMEMAMTVQLPEGLRQQVAHCILAHHGRREWGSPVEPQTLEAQILHYADMLSSLWGLGR